MSKIDDVKEFAHMTKQIFQDLIEIGSVKAKNISLAISEDEVIRTKEEIRDEANTADKYVERYYDLKEEANSQVKNSYIVEKDTNNLELNFKEENLIQAVIYSEILGKPKAKRRRRW